MAELLLPIGGDGSVQVKISELQSLDLPEGGGLPSKRTKDTGDLTELQPPLEFLPTEPPKEGISFLIIVATISLIAFIILGIKVWKVIHRRILSKSGL